ncbi:unnamed protein product [Zymoseptoria tritici ST99CH_1E4]|uniref:Apple domain-containing protein n=1 Tax=Zymoseptoria tritici ST99CH_1E4 TaxID=1276532 RepID=A0A2H1GXX7_ZYMTR|nr:unnamed protein product [Zymoseptoria tritici ST99CH_1E4]
MKLFAGLLLALPFVDAIDCGITGYPVSWAYFSKTDANLATQKSCGTLCKKDVKCNSFAVKPQCVESEERSVEVLGPIVQGRGAHHLDHHNIATYYNKFATIDVNYIRKDNDNDNDNDNVFKGTGHFDSRKRLHYLDYQQCCRHIVDDQRRHEFDFGQRRCRCDIIDHQAFVDNLAGCMAQCKLGSKCRAFAVDDATCYLYDQGLDGNFGYDPDSKKIFFDAGCLISATAPASSQTTSTTTLSTTDTTTSVSTSSSEPAAVDSTTSTTSAGPVVFPTDDPNFPNNIVAYEDFTLDVVDMGVSPVTGLLADTSLQAPAPCVLNPTDPNALFELLSKEGMPLIANQAANSLSPLPSPTSQAAANALGPAEDFQVPHFSFQQPAGAPQGLYDILIVAPTPKFVAKAANGDIVLTDASTGAAGQTVNGQKLYTTIFGVNCQGFLSITQDGQSYTSNTDKGKINLIAASDGGKSMLTLPVTPIPSSRRRRRSIWNEGTAPRCPATPDFLTGQVRVQDPPVRPAQSNGCGGAASAKFVPNFSFGACCSGHDLCYDDCAKGNFETCNNEFRSCMRGQGCDELNHWYTWAFYRTCLATADFYYWTVTGDAARGAFNDATKDRCECKCPNNLTLCPKTSGGGVTCTDTTSTDMQNCGGCARKCPARARCSGGSCICPIDTCGNRCTDFQSSSNNCGSCGNVCASGYCYKGQCYDPPADTCTTASGFSNGDFARGGDGWTFGTLTGVAFDPVADDTASLQIGFRSQLLKKLTRTFETEVEMCPGVEYDLTFLWRRISGGDSCQMSLSFGDTQVFSGAVPDGQSWIDPSSHSTGPFQVGQNGVRQSSTSKNIYVKFSGAITCTNVAGGFGLRDEIRLDSFAISST